MSKAVVDSYSAIPMTEMAKILEDPSNLLMERPKATRRGLLWDEFPHATEIEALFEEDVKIGKGILKIVLGFSIFLEVFEKELFDFADNDQFQLFDAQLAKI